METLFSFTYMRAIVATLGVLLIILVGGAIMQTFHFDAIEPDYATINVEGVAEVQAVPDVGSFSFTVEEEAADVATAQEAATKKINEIMTYLKNEGGVEEKDIKTTGYNTYPRYEWEQKLCVQGNCSNERVLKGYVVSQQVTVKVRDTEKAGDLIAEVGTREVNNMSGLSFEVDDFEAKKEEARLAAIADAKEKAKRLAAELDVRLGDIISFSDGGGYYPPMPYAMEGRATMGDMDMAEESMAANKAVAPEISVGEDTITAHVTITYKIK